MSQPQPGDRVRITYDGRWIGRQEADTRVMGLLGRVEIDNWWGCPVPSSATIEVLPPLEEERQIKEAFIDGYMSALGGRLRTEAAARRRAEIAWREENTTSSDEVVP